MSESSTTHCPQCGAEMPRSTEGLCPRCLMAQIVQPTQDGGESNPALPPLTPEELAPHFPQRLAELNLFSEEGMTTTSAMIDAQAAIDEVARMATSLRSSVARFRY